MRCSPSYESSHSIFLTLVVAKVALGFASIICFLLLFFGSNSEHAYNSKAFVSTTNDFFVWHSPVLWVGILWKSHHFPVSFFIFPLLFFPCILNELYWIIPPWLYPLVCCLGMPFPYFWFTYPKSHFFYLNIYLMLIAYQYVAPSKEISRSSIFSWMYLCKQPNLLEHHMFLKVLDT